MVIDSAFWSTFATICLFVICVVGGIVVAFNAIRLIVDDD
jgi:hypothetical protein